MTDLGLVQIPDPVHTSTDVVLDHTHPDATQVPEAGIGTINLPIAGLAGPTAEEVFAGSDGEDSEVAGPVSAEADPAGDDQA